MLLFRATIVYQVGKYPTWEHHQALSRPLSGLDTAKVPLDRSSWCWPQHRSGNPPRSACFLCERTIVSRYRGTSGTGHVAASRVAWCNDACFYRQTTQNHVSFGDPGNDVQLVHPELDGLWIIAYSFYTTLGWQEYPHKSTLQGDGPPRSLPSKVHSEY